MAVNPKIPKTLRGIRAYLAVHRMRQAAVARAYGCSHQWISAVVNEERGVAPEIVERLREAINQVEEERCQRRAAS